MGNLAFLERVFVYLMSKSLISNILKALMFKRDVNTSKLARKLNLPQQTLQRIVSGTSTNPHSKTLKPIADFFNISLEQLKGEHPLPESIVSSDLPILVQQKTKNIPLIDWNIVEHYLSESDQDSNSNSVFVDESTPHRSFAVILPDSSMEPYFPKGSLLILDPEKSLRDRCFVLVRVSQEDSIIFRQLIIDGDNKYLKSLHPDLNTFPMRLFTEKDSMLGIMIEFRCKYDQSYGKEEHHETTF
jgi:SOS-response transcriptional repressor LexA